MGFEFFDHTADIGIHAWGDTLEDAFENSALAVFEVMTDTSKIQPIISIDIELDGYDLENLLYKWIESLLYYYDTEILVFSKFHVEIKNLHLKAKAFGEKFDGRRHESRTVVKAMTYHEMSIKFGKRVDITFVVDI